MRNLARINLLPSSQSSGEQEQYPTPDDRRRQTHPALRAYSSSRSFIFVQSGSVSFRIPFRCQNISRVAKCNDTRSGACAALASRERSRRSDRAARRRRPEEGPRPPNDHAPLNAPACLRPARPSPSAISQFRGASRPTTHATPRMTRPPRPRRATGGDRPSPTS